MRPTIDFPRPPLRPTLPREAPTRLSLAPLATALLALVIWTFPGEANAQVLRGSLQNRQERPIVAAALTLRDSSGTVVAGMTSDERGLFHVAVPRPGRYRLDVRRVGFEPWSSESISLGQGESVEIEVTMNEQPTVLATVRVLGRSNREWGRDGWAKRQAAGKGTFLTGAQIEAKRTATISEALRDVPGLLVSYRPFPVILSLQGNRCLNLLVNRLPVPLIPGQPMELTLHQTIGPEQVAGVEIYPQYRDVPPEFRSLAIQNRRPEEAAMMAPATITPDEPGRARSCGIINVWTWRAW